MYRIQIMDGLHIFYELNQGVHLSEERSKWSTIQKPIPLVTFGDPTPDGETHFRGNDWQDLRLRVHVMHLPEVADNGL